MSDKNKEKEVESVRVITKSNGEATSTTTNTDGTKETKQIR